MSRARSLRSLTLSTRRNASPGPPSPTFSEATNASAMDFGPNGPSKIITKANLRASIQAYEDLLNKCASYRAALVAMSQATAGLADAMSTCATLKGPNYEAGTRLQAASGLHHLMGNHWHIMADTLDKQFEKPLRQHLEDYKTVVSDRSNAYERALREKSHIIRETEMGNLRKKNRNLQSFREALAILQRQVEELDELKANHYQDIVEHEEEIWNVVQGKVCLVVRSTLDVFDRLTSKASDPVIEPMLQSIPDPFDAYGPPQADDKIFTILPPLSVMANAPSSTPSPLTASTPDLASSDSSDGIVSANSSWTPSGPGFYESSSAWATTLGSPPSVIPSTSTSPHAVIASTSTSPRPISPTPFARSISPRRHSHPPSVLSHQPRKSESKLRSVLSVIEETGTPRQNGENHTQEGPSRSVSEPVLAASCREVPDNPEEAGWHTVKLKYPGHSPATTPVADDDQVTPRNTSLPSQSPADTPHATRSLSPHSDDTVVLS